MPSDKEALERQQKFWENHWDRIRAHGCDSSSLRNCVSLIQMLPKDNKALDLGCGNGSWIRLVQKRTGTFFVGLDCVIDTLIRNAEKSKLESRLLKFIAGRGEELPFLNETFDFILTNSVMEYTQNMKQVIEEITRILRPNGTWLVSGLIARTLKDTPGPGSNAFTIVEMKSLFDTFFKSVDIIRVDLTKGYYDMICRK